MQKTKITNYEGDRLTKKNLKEAIDAISPKRKTFWNTWIGDLFPKEFQTNKKVKNHVTKKMP